MQFAFMIALLLASASFAGSAIGTDQSIKISGPTGALGGALRASAPGAETVLIIPGSGPTDRDGNSPLGIHASSYLHLAEELARRRIATVRIDKRGMFSSKSAITDANAVTIADYARDIDAWARAITKRSNASCIWVAGHSEGAIVALKAGQDSHLICGIILLASPGRKLSDIMKEQLKANPANAAIVKPGLEGIKILEEGGTVDTAKLPPQLRSLFRPAIQPFLRDIFSYDPADLARHINVPLLIVQGDEDLQITVGDAERIHAAQPKSRLQIIAGMNHVLKSVRGDRAANLAVYADPDRPLADGLADAVIEFISTKGQQRQ